MTVDPSTLVERLRQEAERVAYNAEVDGEGVEHILFPKFIRLVEAARALRDATDDLIGSLPGDDRGTLLLRQSSALEAVRAALASLAEALEGGE